MAAEVYQSGKAIATVTKARGDRVWRVDVTVTTARDRALWSGEILGPDAASYAAEMAFRAAMQDRVLTFDDVDHAPHTILSKSYPGAWYPKTHKANPTKRKPPCGAKGNPCGETKANPSRSREDDIRRSTKIGEDAARLVAAGKAYAVSERDGTVTIRENDGCFYANIAERFYAAAHAKHGPQPNPQKAATPPRRRKGIIAGTVKPKPKPKPKRNPSTRYPKGRAPRALISHHFAEYGRDAAAYERTVGHLTEAGYFVTPADRAWLKTQAQTPTANPRTRRPLPKVRRRK